MLVAGWNSKEVLRLSCPPPGTSLGLPGTFRLIIQTGNVDEEDI